jgi:hypothetical protein
VTSAGPPLSAPALAAARALPRRERREERLGQREGVWIVITVVGIRIHAEYVAPQRCHHRVEGFAHPDGLGLGPPHRDLERLAIRLVRLADLGDDGLGPERPDVLDVLGLAQPIEARL